MAGRANNDAALSTTGYFPNALTYPHMMTMPKVHPPDPCAALFAPPHRFGCTLEPQGPSRLAPRA